MYIRTVRNKLKSGSVACYVQLAYNRRDSLTGKSQLQILHSFGRVELIDREELRRLAASIDRFLQQYP